MGKTLKWVMLTPNEENPWVPQLFMVGIVPSWLGTNGRGPSLGGGDRSKIGQPNLVLGGLFGGTRNSALCFPACPAASD